MMIKNLIEDIKPDCSTIDIGRTVLDALDRMAENGSSAVLVEKNAVPAGIFTERDLIRCHQRFPDKGLGDIPLSSVMTTALIVAETGDTVDEAMAMMVRAKIRHLPVVDKGRICAMVCLEDLVRRRMGELTQELHYLKDYISTLQDAVHD